MMQIVALAETAKAVAQEEAKNDEGETRPNFGQVSKPARGPSIKPGSYRDIEERTGIPQPTIRLAEQHVATLEAHPDVEAAPQSVTVAVGPLSGGKAPALYGKWVGVLTLSTPLEGGSGFFCVAESNVLNRRKPTDALLLSPDEELHSLIVDEVHGIPYTVDGPPCQSASDLLRSLKRVTCYDRVTVFDEVFLQGARQRLQTKGGP